MGDASTGDQPSRYEIQIQGQLDARWVAWLDALSLVNEADGTTRIQVATADQAALHGVLHKLRDIGALLIAIWRVEPDSPAALRPTSSHTTERKQP